MARYIDADKFKNHLEKAMEKMHLIGGVKGVGVEAVIKALDMQPTADVVPRVEFEAMRTATNSYKMHYENLAKEIFEEIDKHLIPKNPPITEIDHFTFLDLKEKYTEEQI